MPQLIRSAEAAKRAFDILAAEKSSKSSTEIQDKAPVIIATVKGDVHDIGKNIVKVVLESYGYPVKDLGKNVAKEDIYNTYLETGALAIGLSALTHRGGEVYCPGRGHGHHHHGCRGGEEYSAPVRRGQYHV